MNTQPKKRSNGLISGPVISLLGCGLGRQSVSNASCVSNVGTAPAHERFEGTRDIADEVAVLPPELPLDLCSGLWPGRGDGRGILGEPGQLVLAGDMAVNGES